MIANQVEGEFETHFRYFVESVGGPEQGSLRCFADGTNQSLVIVCTQATSSRTLGTACLISCEISLFVTAANREGILLATYASLASLARRNWR